MTVITAVFALAQIAFFFEPLTSWLEGGRDYVGETAEFARLSKILEQGEISEEDEIWLFEVARHHPYMSGEPKFALLVNDMLGSLTNRFDLSGTRYWKEKTGDAKMIERRIAFSPQTKWGYDPDSSDSVRLKSLQHLVHADSFIDDSIKNELVKIVVYEDDYRVSAMADCIIDAWEKENSLRGMTEYKVFVRAQERRALTRLFDHHGMIQKGILQTGDTNVVMTYDSLEEDPNVRRMAVKKFVDYYLNRGVNPALVKIPWEAISVLTMIHYWDDSFNVSTAAGAVLYPFPDITVSQARTEKEFVDKNSYGVPPFPWGKLGENPSYYSNDRPRYYGRNMRLRTPTTEVAGSTLAISR